MCSLIYDLLQVLLIKTHIRSSYKPVHLTLSISVSYLTLISGSLNPFISVVSHLIECLQFLDLIRGGFYCVLLCECQSGADMGVGLVLSSCSTLKSHADSIILVIAKMLLY